MTLIEWNEGLSVGLKKIDEQHKILINLINHFYLAVKEKRADSIIAETVVKMKNYTIYHFESEENYFQRYGYPESGAHRRQHDHFIRRVESFQKKIEQGEALSSQDILRFLTEWFVNHIRHSDKRYTNFFLHNRLK